MRKIIKLTDAQVSELSKTKQTGMGFHTVSVKLKTEKNRTRERGGGMRKGYIL